MIKRFNLEFITHNKNQANTHKFVECLFQKHKATISLYNILLNNLKKKTGLRDCMKHVLQSILGWNVWSSSWESTKPTLLTLVVHQSNIAGAKARNVSFVLSLYWDDQTFQPRAD